MKTKIYFGFLALLFALGCSNEELINDSSDNSQLRKGNGVNSITFYGNSIVDNNYFELAELADGSKILKNGKCSGKIIGYGSINPNLSIYTFETCDPVKNYDYPEYGGFEYNYILVGKGTVALNAMDYFEFSIIKGLYSPWNYGTEMYKGAMFTCNNSGQGEAKITLGSGKFKAFEGKPLDIYNALTRNNTAIDRLSGKMYLMFNIRN